jgi:cytochrome c biogenesis protein CcdA
MKGAMPSPFAEQATTGRAVKSVHSCSSPRKARSSAERFLGGRRRLFHHDFWVITGGMLVNLVIVVVTSVLFSLLPPAQRAQEWLLPLVSTLSLGMVIGSFLPFSQRSSGLDSDGLQLLRLLSERKKY